jgi:hypothetical protein
MSTRGALAMITEALIIMEQEPAVALKFLQGVIVEGRRGTNPDPGVVGSSMVRIQMHRVHIMGIMVVHGIAGRTQNKQDLRIQSIINKAGMIDTTLTVVDITVRGSVLLSQSWRNRLLINHAWSLNPKWWVPLNVRRCQIGRMTLIQIRIKSNEYQCRYLHPA